jgi:hypothetical protein
LTALLVVLALLLKSAIPAGFMPAFDQEGFTQIVICSGMGQKTVTVPSNDAPATDHRGDTASKLCAYQLLASGKTILPPFVAIVFAPIVTRASAAIADDADAASVISFSFEARGPPAA